MINISKEFWKKVNKFSKEKFKNWTKIEMILETGHNLLEVVEVEDSMIEIINNNHNRNHKLKIIIKTKKNLF